MTTPLICIYLPIHFAHDDIEGAEDDTGVREFVADGDLTETGQVDKAGWADVVAVRVHRAVGDEIKADLAFGALDARVRLALGRPEDLRHLGSNITLGNGVERLLQDAGALPHLLETDHVAVEAVAVVVDRHVPVESIVDRVRLCSTHVVV